MLKLTVILTLVQLVFSKKMDNDYSINLNSSLVNNNNLTEIEQDDLKQKLESLRDIVNVYYLPLIVSVGIIGNTLTLIILTFENKLSLIYDINSTFRQNLKMYYDRSMSKNQNYQNTLFNNYKKSHKTSHFASSNYFIVFLAISDLIYNFILACVWITRLGLNILNIKYICQFSVMISYICSFLSAAFTTLFTFQRFMAVANPLKSFNNFLNSKKAIVRLTVVLIIFSFIVYSFSLFLYDTSSKKDHEVSAEHETCGVNEKYSNLVYTIDNTVDSFLTLIIPAFGIIVMNLAICKSLSNYRKSNILNDENSMVAKRQAKNSMISIKPLSEKDLNACERFSLETDTELKSNNDITERKISRNLTLPKHKQNVNKDNNSSRHITKMLLIVSFAFLLLNSPFRLSKLVSFINMLGKKNYVYSNLDFIINEVLINLYFTSYSVNFFLYSLCGKKFKQSLKSLVFYFVFIFYKRVRIILDSFKK